MNGEWITVSGPSASPGRAPVPGPSLRQDIPRPPLRYLALRMLRRQRQMTAAAVTAIDASWQAAQQLTREQFAAAQIMIRHAADRARESATAPAPSSSAPFAQHTTAAFVAGPSLRQDRPRPPLRGFALRTLRRQRQMAAALVTLIDASWRAVERRTRLRLAAAHISLRRAAERAYARAARHAAQAIARLDAHVWQPAMWPFRPAQREMLARSMAALSVAIVALTWIVATSTLAPATQAARPPAPPPAPPKQFAERIVTRAPLPAAVPIVEVPHPVPAPHR